MSNARRLFVDEKPNSIHGPFIPADIREGEQISARAKSNDPNFFFNHEMRVWRISPLGVELVLEPGMKAHKGLHLILDIQMGFQKTSLESVIVEVSNEHEDIHIMYCRLVPRENALVEGVDRRESNRWLCSDQFFPTAVASNPAKFNDFIYFKIKDISFGGFKIHTSLRNKFIIKGLVFDSLVNFPMISQVNMKLTVKSVRIELESGKEVLALGVTWDTRDEKLTDVVGSYLMQFGSVGSLADVQESGFMVHSVSDSVTYSYVKTKEEFSEVLKLRKAAYFAANKVSEDRTPESMSDQFDSRSRIIIGRYNGEVVCTARMTFHQLGDKLEQESFVQWDAKLPRQDEVVEIMRACTSPEFRGSDLLIGMFKYMSVTVAQSKKDWIVICATDEMVPFYEKVGFKNISLSYNHTGLNNIKHHVMLANFVDGMTGKSVGPIYWNLVWGDSVSYLTQYDLINIDPFTQIRLTIYRWFSTISRILYKRKIKAKMRGKRAE